MKTYIYTVSGIKTSQDEDEIIKALSQIEEISEPYASSISSSLTVSIDEDSRDVIEKKLAELLSSLGYELILPANVKNYVYDKNANNTKTTKQIKLSSAIAICAVVAVFCILFTYVFASGTFSSPSLNNNGKTDAYIDQLELLDEIFNTYYYYDLDEKEMGEGLLKAYVYATGDRYAEYYTAAEYAELQKENTGEMVGVGISIVNSTVEINGVTYSALHVTSVYENSPAMKSGVKVGDCIVSVIIDGKEQSITELGYTMALEKLKGEAGSTAEFVVCRPLSDNDGEYDLITFEIKREKIVTQSVSYSVCETDKNVGIIRIAQFDLTTPVQFKNAVETLRAGGIKYFVFDLRNNPGGDLESIAAVLSYFLNEGDLIISTEYKDSRNDQTRLCKPIDHVKTGYSSAYASCDVKSNEIGMYKNLDFAVLTNKNTASAAELFTATVKDYSLGVTVGETTYGKGCMQNIIPLSRYGLDGALRVTTALYFSKSHTDYHEKGIEPHFPVKLSEEASKYSLFLLPHDIDNQLQTAINEIKK